MKVILIAAKAANNVIGKDGRIPWKIPDDMQHFKRMTEGNIVIMGRKTYESLGKPLKNRKNIVVSKTLRKQITPKKAEQKGILGVESEDGLVYADSLMDALQIAEEHLGGMDVFLIGGKHIYEEGLSVAEKLVLTEIKREYEGDVYFPDFDESLYEKHIIQGGFTMDEEKHEGVSYDIYEYVKI